MDAFPQPWPVGTGEMPARIRGHGWGGTPLGAIATWPQSLRTAVDLMLAMPGPATLLWGREGIQLYNDAYIPVARDRHPALLGRPVATGWADVYADVIRPLLDTVWNGRAARLSDYAVPLIGEHGTPEDRVFDTDWTPVRNEQGAVAGALQTLVEVTGRHRAEQEQRRRESHQRFLLCFSDSLRAEDDPDAVAMRAIAMLAEEMRLDRCAIAAYRLDDDRVDFTHQVGNERIPPLPRSVRLTDFPDALRQVLERTIVIEDNWARTGLTRGERDSSMRLAMRALLASTARQGKARPLRSMLAAAGEPRSWSPAEIALVEEAAERTWAAVARAEAEAAVRASEKRYRELFATMAQGYVECELIRDAHGAAVDYRLLDANRHYERLVGMPREAMIGLNVRSIVPGLEARSIDAFATVVRENRAIRFQQEAAGSGRCFEVEAYPLGGDRFAVLYADITARRQADAQLRASEERLRRFAEASSAVLWIRVADTLQWEYLSHAFERIYGLPCAEAMKGDTYRNWSELILPEDRAHAMAQIERVRRGERVTFDYRIRRPVDGEIRWMRNTDFPILDQAGRVTRIGGVGEDVTELKNAERALAESEARLRTLMEGIPQLVWRSGGEGKWTWASRQWCRFTGQPQEGSHGLGWLDAVHPDDRAAALGAWRAARQQGLLDVEYRVRRAADGAWVWHHTRSVPLRDVEEAVVEWLGTSTDIQQMKELQERQTILVAELQHRVRNMLTVVRSVFSRTAEDADDVEEVASHFRGRLDALARTQVIVTGNAERRVDLEDLVREELLSVGVSDGAALQIAGPAVSLPHDQAESMGLAIHELTTNAVKYGALKVKTGRLNIEWSVNLCDRSSQILKFMWSEQGVPAVPLHPAREGFGRELIEEALPYRLGAETELEFRPGGVRCRIVLPLDDDDASAQPIGIGR